MCKLSPEDTKEEKIMSTIFERLEKKLDKIENKTKVQVKKELIHERVEEIYRGKDVFEKLKGVIRILTA